MKCDVKPEKSKKAFLYMYSNYTVAMWLFEGFCALRRASVRKHHEQVETPSPLPKPF